MNQQQKPLTPKAIIKKMCAEMPWDLHPGTIPYIVEAMQIHTKQFINIKPPVSESLERAAKKLADSMYPEDHREPENAVLYKCLIEFALSQQPPLNLAAALPDDVEDKVLEIIQANYNKFKGTNEAEIHSAKDIAQLFTCLQSLPHAGGKEVEWPSEKEIYDKADKRYPVFLDFDNKDMNLYSRKDLFETLKNYTEWLKTRFNQPTPPAPVSSEAVEKIKYVLAYDGVFYKAKFTIGVQTFTVCSRETKEEAEFYIEQLKKAFEIFKSETTTKK